MNEASSYGAAVGDTGERGAVVDVNTVDSEEFIKLVHELLI